MRSFCFIVFVPVAVQRYAFGSRRPNPYPPQHKPSNSRNPVLRFSSRRNCRPLGVRNTCQRSCEWREVKTSLRDAHRS